MRWSAWGREADQPVGEGGGGGGGRGGTGDCFLFVFFSFRLIMRSIWRSVLSLVALVVFISPPLPPVLPPSLTATPRAMASPGGGDGGKWRGKTERWRKRGAARRPHNGCSISLYGRRRARRPALSSSATVQRLFENFSYWSRRKLTNYETLIGICES